MTDANAPYAFDMNHPALEGLKWHGRRLIRTEKGIVLSTIREHADGGTVLFRVEGYFPRGDWFSSNLGSVHSYISVDAAMKALVDAIVRDHERKEKMESMKKATKVIEPEPKVSWWRSLWPW